MDNRKLYGLAFSLVYLIVLVILIALGVEERQLQYLNQVMLLRNTSDEGK
jgi:hypothetical protein